MQTSHSYPGGDSQSTVKFRKPTPGQFPYYEVHGDQLSHGPSLGNRKIWVTTEATGHIKRIFCNAIGRDLLGTMIITYAVPTGVLLSSIAEPSDEAKTGGEYVLLERRGSGTTKIYPFRAQRLFELAGELAIEETVLVPKLPHDDPPAVLKRIRISNRSSKDTSVLITVHFNMQGGMGEDLVVRFNDDLSALELYNESNPDWVRIVGASDCSVTFRTTRDVSTGHGGELEPKLKDEACSARGPFGEIQLELPIKAGSTAERTVTIVLSHAGFDDARKWYQHSLDFAHFDKATNAFLTPASGMSMIETPDPVINQGVFWAKVDMFKVLSDYPMGFAFTNDPGRSTNVVGRDIAWYTFGCDYLAPDISRVLLEQFAEKQYDSGKMPEYYNAIDGCVEDYQVSVNDDTPLFILACCHHYAVTHNKDFADVICAVLRRATDYILSQRDERGLIISNADGYAEHGIASWRNVIPNYQINGAVTEINSECYGALKAMAEMCGQMGKGDDADRFNKAADQLREAINKHLLNPENGLYYLNIDSTGLAHTDVTSDEVFPVLFGVAPQPVASRIVSRLREDDFLTSAGLRIVPRNSPDYEPSELVGLKGGVWPGVAFWYAVAAAEEYPEFMVDSMHAGYLQYLTDPLKNNTVPGQFSEWFDGESLVNRGMRLSPWEPPRLLWAAVEGLCGVKMTGGKCSIAPTHPEHWKWLALRRMPHQGSWLTFFAVTESDGLRLYTSAPVHSPYPVTVAGDDVSQYVHVNDYRIHRAAFRDGDTLTLCLGSEPEAFSTVSITLHDLLDRDTDYNVRMCSRALGWEDIGTHNSAALSDAAVNIEGGEFRVITMTKVRP